MGENAGDLAALAERLRAVRAARRHFLRLWGIEQAVIHPVLDRVAADVERGGPEDGAAPQDALPYHPGDNLYRPGDGFGDGDDFSDPWDGRWTGADGWPMNG